MLRRIFPLALITLVLLVSGCHIWLRPAVMYSVGYCYPPPPAPPPPPYWWYDYWYCYYWCSPCWGWYDHWHWHYRIWIDIHYYCYEWWPDPPRRYRWGHWLGPKRYKRGKYAGEWKWEGGSKRSKVATVKPAAGHKIALPGTPGTAGNPFDMPDPKGKAVQAQRGLLPVQKISGSKQSISISSTSEATRPRDYSKVEDRLPKSPQSFSERETGRELSRTAAKHSETASASEETEARVAVGPALETRTASQPPRTAAKPSDPVRREPQRATRSQRYASDEKTATEPSSVTPRRSGASVFTRESATRSEGPGPDTKRAGQSPFSDAGRSAERGGNRTGYSSFSRGQKAATNTYQRGGGWSASKSGRRR